MARTKAQKMKVYVNEFNRLSDAHLKKYGILYKKDTHKIQAKALKKAGLKKVS